MTMEQLGSLGDLLGATPGGVEIGMLREPFDQGMRFLAKCSGLLRCKLSLDEQITVLVIKVTLLLCQHPSLPFLIFRVYFCRPRVYQTAIVATLGRNYYFSSR